MSAARMWLLVGAVAAISAQIGTLATIRRHPVGKP
jgi:hypothetical protein